MKRKKTEGTLESLELVGDDFESASTEVAKVAFVGLPDFIAKARALIKRVDAAPHRLRAQRAKSLARDLDAIERAMRRGVDQSALYDAIGAALTFATLSNAERDDAPVYSKKKAIKVGAFLSAENRVLKRNAKRNVRRAPDRKEIAAEMDVHTNSVDRLLRRDITEK